jgi:hypothetical protein
LTCGATSTAATAATPANDPPATQLAPPAFTSSSEESHLSLIQETLNEIKDRLGKLEQSQQEPKSPFEIHIVATERNASSGATTIFQNEPSFNNQSAQASISAELSAKEANVTEFNMEIQSSLVSLKSRLQGQNVPSSVNHLYFPCSSSRLSTQNVELPPVSIVIAALKKAAGQYPVLSQLKIP